MCSRNSTEENRLTESVDAEGDQAPMLELSELALRKKLRNFSGSKGDGVGQVFWVLVPLGRKVHCDSGCLKVVVVIVRFYVVSAHRIAPIFISPSYDVTVRSPKESASRCVQRFSNREQPTGRRE